MNEISPEQLLSQIRTMGRDLQTGPAVQPPAETGFGDLLKNSLDSVNDMQQTAKELKTGFETGTGDKTLAEVMLASEKAGLSFRFATEVRNKLVTAYQDIMNMPV